MAHKEWCLSWYLSSETKQPYPCNCGADVEIALARAAEAEARATVMETCLAEIMRRTQEASGDTAMSDAALDWMADLYDVCSAARDAGPGPLLALARAAGLFRYGLPAGFAATYPVMSRIRALRAAWDALPAWLRDYLTREAGDAEPR